MTTPEPPLAPGLTRLPGVNGSPPPPPPPVFSVPSTAAWFNAT